MSISGDIQIRRLPGWEGLEWIEARDVVGDIPRHIHESFCVGMIRAGVRKMRIQNKDESYRTGQIWLIRPGEAHDCSTDGAPHDYMAICFEPIWAGELFGAGASGFGDPASVQGWTRETRKLFGLLQKTKASLELETPLIDWMVRFFFSENLATENGDGDKDRIKQVQWYLDEHYAENSSIMELSKMAGLSPFHLERVFQKSVGVPIHLYQKMVRLRAARKMLREGRSLSYVATETGFTDQSHFSRVFKTIMGISPGEYARSCQKE